MSASTVIAGIIFLILLGYLIRDYQAIADLADYLSQQETYVLDALEGKDV